MGRATQEIQSYEPDSGLLLSHNRYVVDLLLVTLLFIHLVRPFISFHFCSIRTQFSGLQEPVSQTKEIYKIMNRDQLAPDSTSSLSKGIGRWVRRPHLLCTLPHHPHLRPFGHCLYNSHYAPVSPKPTQFYRYQPPPSFSSIPSLHRLIVLNN